VFSVPEGRQILLLLQYDGTAYHGWQSQRGVATVQDTLETAITRLTGERYRAKASSRLDSGVHARGLPVVVRTDTTIPLIAFERGLTSSLPHDIAVVEAVEAPPDFDVRRNSGGKIYRYSVWNGRYRAPLLGRFSWRVAAPLSMEAMREAAAPLVGRNDFAAFRSASCQSRTTIRTLDRVSIDCGKSASDRHLLTFTISGDAFLQHMIRILVGTLVDVGKGSLPTSVTETALGTGIRKDAGQTAPSRGLVLDLVRYDPSPFQRRPPGLWWQEDTPAREV
jgi:tRNA pseudouridine38-40 synthase